MVYRYRSRAEVNVLQSLERQSGLPIFLNPADGTLDWEARDIAAGKTSDRPFSEMKRYIADAEAEATTNPIYRMWREVAREHDRQSIIEVGLRYDLTVVLPGCFAGGKKEFFRTAGHYHAVEPMSGLSYPELYEVISGRAYWLLQKRRGNEDDAIEEIYAVEAGPGEKALIPPGFGHMSVNAFSEPLVMANWIANDFSYEYAPYERFRGSGYWMFEGDGGTIEFEKNSNYTSVAEIKKLRPKEIPSLGLIRSRPAYALTEDLSRLEFLTHPAKFAPPLALDRCYSAIV